MLVRLASSSTDSKPVRRPIRPALGCWACRIPRTATRVTRLKGGMTSAADDDPSCKEMVVGGRTNPRTGVPSNLLADISRSMNQNALEQLPFG